MDAYFQNIEKDKDILNDTTTSFKLENRANSSIVRERILTMYNRAGTRNFEIEDIKSVLKLAKDEELSTDTDNEGRSAKTRCN